MGMMLGTETPGLIGLPRKSLNSPSQVSRSIEAACHAAVGIDVPMPVFHDGRAVAIVRGNARSPVVDVYERTPKLWCALNSYADITDALAAERSRVTKWQKNATAAGVADNYYDLWAVDGDPTSGAYAGAALTAVQFSDTSTGAIMHGGNVSTSNKHLIRHEVLASASTTPVVIIYDRVLTYEACTISASNQVMTNGLAAQRYIGSGEPGLKIMVTCQTALGATANAFTQLQYTDNSGNTLQSMPTTNNVNVIVSAAAPTTTRGARVVSPSLSGGTFSFGPFMPLATGDTGVRLIDNVTSSAGNTGTLAYVLCFPIALIPIINGTNPSLATADQIMQTTSFGQVKDGACLAPIMYMPTATGATYTGRIDTVWG